MITIRGNEALNVDRVISHLAVASYYTLVFAFLPSTTYMRMLGGATVLLLVLTVAASALAGRSPESLSILGLSFVAIAILVIPGFDAVGHRTEAVSLGIFGTEALVVFWISLRWETVPKQDERLGLGTALFYACCGAIALSAVATIPVLLILLGEGRSAAPLLLVYPAYFGGALAAALLYWLLQGLQHRPLGRYVIGVLGGFCVYGAVAPVVMLLNKDPMSSWLIMGIAAVCGLIVGPPVALRDW